MSFTPWFSKCFVSVLILSSFVTTLSRGIGIQQIRSISSGDSFAFKSNDGGLSWSTIIDSDTGLSAHVARFIVVDPSTNATLYVGTNNGLAKSTDGGESWSEINDGLGGLNIESIIVDPLNPSVLYTLTFSQSGSSGTIYKSTNAGNTWKQTSLRDPAFSLTIDPVNSSVLYAGGNDPDGAGIHKTTNGGGSWSYVRINGLGGGATIDQLALDPFAPANLYAGNRGGINRGGLSKSTDAGRTWLPTSLEEVRIRSVVHDPRGPSKPYVVTSESLLNSSDGGESWVNISHNLKQGPISSLAIDRTDSATLFVGTQYGPFKSSDGGVSWVGTALARSIASLAIDPTNRSIIYAGGVADPPLIVAASVDGKRLFVEGKGFHPGAKIYLDGQKQKTVNDPESGHTKLIGKKAGKKIDRGQTVSLSVVDADGVASQQFLFTRPID